MPILNTMTKRAKFTGLLSSTTIGNNVSGVKNLNKPIPPFNSKIALRQYPDDSSVLRKANTDGWSQVMQVIWLVLRKNENITGSI